MIRKGLIYSILLTSIFIMSCNQSQKVAESISQDTITFLGRYVVDNDSVYEQIAAIAENDSMLSYSDNVLQIGDVRWGVNINGPKLHIILMSSVQPNALEMKQVIQYLSNLYGEPNRYEEGDEEFGRLSWPRMPSSPDSITPRAPGGAILRRIHGDEGGSVLFLE